MLRGKNEGHWHHFGIHLSNFVCVFLLHYISRFTHCLMHRKVNFENGLKFNTRSSIFKTCVWISSCKTIWPSELWIRSLWIYYVFVFRVLKTEFWTTSLRCYLNKDRLFKRCSKTKLLSRKNSRKKKLFSG